MAVSFSTVPFVLGLILSCGSAMLGDVFYTENRLNPAKPEVHAIHKDIPHTHVGYNGVPNSEPLSFYDSGVEVAVVEGDKEGEMDPNRESIENDSQAEVMASDFMGGGNATIKQEQEEEDKNKVVTFGTKKVSKNFAIGSLAGVIIVLMAACLPVGIIIAVLKKKKANKSLVA